MKKGLSLFMLLVANITLGLTTTMGIIQWLMVALIFFAGIIQRESYMDQ